jgi:hypothetical protein
VPPVQVEPPVLAMEAAVLRQSVAVFPKNWCRCEPSGLPGATIGSE